MYINPMMDMYMSAMYKIEQNNMETEGLQEMDFDASGNYLFAPQSDASIAQIVYYSETKAVAYVNNTNSTTNDTQKFNSIYCVG